MDGWTDGRMEVFEKRQWSRKQAQPTKITFSMSLDWHQWNIPVESYFLMFSSTLSICSFPGMRRGSCLIKENQAGGEM